MLSESPAKTDLQFEFLDCDPHANILSSNTSDKSYTVVVKKRVNVPLKTGCECLSTTP